MLIKYSMAYDNLVYNGPHRLAMYGKNIIEEWCEYTNYILDIDLSTLDRSPQLINSTIVESTSWTTEYFLYLYNTVGKDYKWWYYNYKEADYLKDYLNHADRLYLTLLYNGEPSGMSIIFYDKDTNTSNLEYFGLCPNAIGKKIGREFLHDSIIKETRCNQMWVYTGSYDHPAALPNYKAVGFTLRDVKPTQEYIPLYVFD